MPRRNRSELVDLDREGLYHCVNRCVRRARLCGRDPQTHQDYTHRKRRIRRELRRLAALFAIDLGWYAVLENHLHVVLRTRPDVADGWSPREVIRRACRLFPWLFRQLAEVEQGQPTEQQLAALARDEQLVEKMRRRLKDPSWLMGRLCERTAKRANQEDGVTGRFWEGRFKSREITDELGLVVCGLYVDLNAVRAGLAQTPEESSYTSAHDRILGMRSRRSGQGAGAASQHDGWLAPLSLEDGDGQQGYPPQMRASTKGLLPLRLEEYLVLLDYAGRVVREGKAGSIPPELPPILERLDVKREACEELIRRFEEVFKTAAGRPASLAQLAERRGGRWVHGLACCRRILGASGASG